MAYARITTTHDGAQAIQYACGGKEGKGHNKNEVRNEYISGLNLIPGISVIPQFQKYWDMKRSNHTVQVLRIIQSFSRNELNPDDPNDIAIGHEIGIKFARRYYPHRQVLVFTQIDGESGLIHNHIIVNDVDMNDFKGCNRDQKNVKKIREWNDKVTSEELSNINRSIDHGNKSDKYTRTERVKREKGEYSWKDDIRERVSAAMSECTSEEDFVQKCKLHGVNAEKRHRAKTDTDYFTYTLENYDNAPPDFKLPKGYKKLSIRSYNLEERYDYEGLIDQLNNPDADKNTVSVTAVKNQRDTGPDLKTCCNDFFDYAVNKTMTKKNLSTSFPADQYYQQLNQTIVNNQIQINMILGMMAVLNFLNNQKQAMIYNQMLYDLIDQQRKLKKERVQRNIEEQQKRDAKERVVRHNKKDLNTMLNDIENGLDKIVRYDNENEFKL